MNPEQLTGQTETHLTHTTIGTKVFQVHHEVVQDLLALKQAASDAGFNLCIASGFRDFQRQAAIWNSKMRGERDILNSHSQPIDPLNLNDAQKVSAILRWSALPGASRHHWGTDFDIYDSISIPEGVTLKLEPWEYLTGHQQHFYQWLSSHLHQFGFYFPYKEERGGVAIEPWHISHVKTGNACLSALSIDVLRSELHRNPIQGNNTVLDSLEAIYTQYITNVNSAEM
ncbi:M15 family metallopeptidase [uncultured Vibrio sp.]|uniref:M15 family metallopeptidase n=1 Tax=uncultured Vibrio sp. TaxID=114054 RepID=UPI000916AA52|nr:M15 family metallopeptidase [uncultured Vibrio sp.]OIQ25560.1 MAG: peptidase M15 [Vibrio sp. MedPE-SWchi]